MIRESVCKAVAPLSPLAATTTPVMVGATVGLSALVPAKLDEAHVPAVAKLATEFTSYFAFFGHRYRTGTKINDASTTVRPAHTRYGCANTKLLTGGL